MRHNRMAIGGTPSSMNGNVSKHLPRYKPSPKQLKPSPAHQHLHTHKNTTTPPQIPFSGQPSCARQTSAHPMRAPFRPTWMRGRSSSCPVSLYNYRLMAPHDKSEVVDLCNASCWASIRMKKGAVHSHVRSGKVCSMYSRTCFVPTFLPLYGSSIGALCSS